MTTYLRSRALPASSVRVPATSRSSERVIALSSPVLPLPVAVVRNVGWAFSQVVEPVVE